MAKNKIIDLAASFWLKEEDVLNQIRNEYEQWLATVQTKRKKRVQDWKKFVPINKKDKVNINSIYTTIQTLLSVFFSDKMTVKWTSRKPSSQSKADQLNKVSEFDYEEMGLEKIDYQWMFNTFMDWVGIKIIDGWDKDKQVPVARVISAISWIPDPRGGFTIEDHRWAWFEAEDVLYQLKANPNYVNTNLINNAPNNEQESIRAEYLASRSLSDQGYETVENKKYAIYHHYTVIRGEKYLVTTANHHTLIIRMKKLKPITKEEKASPYKISFPISLLYYSPVKGDPFGISVPDLMRDKQDAESKLFNLAVIKETRNTLGEDIYYDPNAISNKSVLEKPSIYPKAVPVKIRPNENIGQKFFRLPKEQSTGQSFNVGSQLQFQNSLSTGIDANTLWVGGQAGQTATEAQIIQKNANLRFGLGTKVMKWAQEHFWKTYLRYYLLHLSPRSEKFIYTTSGFGRVPLTLRRRDFLQTDKIDVTIRSVSEIEQEKQKQKADFFAIYPQLLADPNLPAVSKNYIERKALLLSGVPEDEIEIMKPKSVDQINAELDVELINAGEAPNPPKPWEDHLTYIYVYCGAEDSAKEVKFDAIRARRDAFLNEGGNQRVLNEVDPQLKNIAASNAAQQNSANISGQLWQIPSNQS